MQVIAGRAKGRKLVVPAGGRTRPTPARVREALFSMLCGMLPLEGARVLDLFAGSGALGIEALSRGARLGHFVEVERAALAALRRNLDGCGMAPQAHVWAAPARLALRQLQRQAQRFEAIFVDPPYAAAALPATLAALAAAGLLTFDGIVVCEHHGRAATPPPPCGWEVRRTRHFGDVALALMGPARGASER